MKNNDVELIHKILAGDDAAFASLVKKYQKQVHALAWRKIGDFHIAEEIVQDTFLKVYQNLSTLKNPNQFSGWLYVITANQCHAWLRKRRIETEPLEDTDINMIEGTAYSKYIAAEQAKGSIETQREVVKKLLSTLKESDRTVITLYYFGEMTCEEISRFLGVSTSAIKSRLSRARRRLKKEEPTVREALSNFQISANLTDNIMREVANLQPAVPSGSNPFMPWLLATSTSVLILLLVGMGSRYLARFQQPYSLDMQSEMTVELIDAPMVQNIDAKPDVRNLVGNNSDTPGRGSGTEPVSNQVLSDLGDYTQWQLPEGAKSRLGKGKITGNVAFSPDGARLAVGSAIGIWIYDVRPGKEKELDLLTEGPGSGQRTRIFSRWCRYRQRRFGSNCPFVGCCHRTAGRYIHRTCRGDHFNRVFSGWKHARDRQCVNEKRTGSQVVGSPNKRTSNNTQRTYRNWHLYSIFSRWEDPRKQH